MIEFYVDVRADDVRLDDDGDMFLFQWGTWDWGDGPLATRWQLWGAASDGVLGPMTVRVPRVH
jgi:hypothetical protein